jgi:SAM-dependent methyltransferase
VGSGVGTLDFYLAEKGKNVFGIEISEKAFDIAQKTLTLFKFKNNLKFISMDIYKAHFKKVYDFVICSEVLEHLPNDKRALTKIYKATKKDGIFMLTVPSLNAPLEKFGSIKAFDNRSGHLRRYSVDSTEKLLKEVGFTPIYSQRTEGIIRNALFVYPWGDIFIRLANRFPLISGILTFIDKISLSLFGESQIIVVSKKL